MGQFEIRHTKSNFSKSSSLAK